MNIAETDIAGLIVFEPTPHRDERGYFTRTQDVTVLREAGIDPVGFVQDNQSRSYQGVVRGMHGRGGGGEAKLVRCAHGAVLDVVVDARPDSATFGAVRSFLLDDQLHRQLYIPRGFLHGYQAITSVTDVCYRMDAFYGPGEDVTIAWNDPDLGIAWPAPVTIVSERDRAGISWAEYAASLRATEPPFEGAEKNSTTRLA